MFELVNADLEKKMNDTLHFVSKMLDESGHNTKPVLLHSFKVAMTLYSFNYKEDIVIAGILHDLIEDTDVTYDIILKEYGKNIADIVKAVSFNPKIEDKLEQAKIMFTNCVEFGYDALIVKCADLLDNINFVKLVSDKIIQEKLLKKYKLFLEMSETQIKKEFIYINLKERYEKILNEL